MLSGSINPDDLKMATDQYSHIIGAFYTKPLFAKVVEDIMEKYF